MKTVGDILKKARLDHKIDIDQLASYTKINRKYLDAIEANDFARLPAAAFTKGFLHTYATIVGVNPDQVLAIFRRDYDQDSKGRIIPRGLIHPIKTAPRGITPNLLTILTTVTIGLIAVMIFIWQTIQFSAAPDLTLEEPAENAVMISPVTIRGVTDPLVTLTVNNRPVLIDSSGSFMTQVQLSPGQHTLVLVAAGRTGKKTSMERIIYIQLPPTQ